MANRPRLYCPKCHQAVRRVYLQNPAASPGEDWLYCAECNAMQTKGECRSGPLG